MARFGVQVVCGYQHTCALTGYRIITQDGESVEEAAHIEPWAKMRNDDIHNGLALSRNVIGPLIAGYGQWTISFVS